MPEENVKLSAKHCTILRSFTDLHGHFRVPRKNANVHYWDDNSETVVFRVGCDNPLQFDPEWLDLIRWGLIQETDLGHPIYELTEKARIYVSQ